jgi:hypothetical protein
LTLDTGTQFVYRSIKVEIIPRITVGGPTPIIGQRWEQPRGCTEFPAECDQRKIKEENDNFSNFIFYFSVFCANYIQTCQLRTIQAATNGSTSCALDLLQRVLLLLFRRGRLVSHQCGSSELQTRECEQRLEPDDNSLWYQQPCVNHVSFEYFKY